MHSERRHFVLLCGGAARWGTPHSYPQVRGLRLRKINAKTISVSKKIFRKKKLSRDKIIPKTFGPQKKSGCRFSLLTGNDTCRIMVGCRCCTHPSIRTKTCRRVGLLGPHCKRKGDCGHVHPCWRLYLHPRLFEFTSLRHSRHCAEITLCQHLLKPSQKRGLSLSECLGLVVRTWKQV